MQTAHLQSCMPWTLKRSMQSSCKLTVKQATKTHQQVYVRY